MIVLNGFEVIIVFVLFFRNELYTCKIGRIRIIYIFCLVILKKKKCRVVLGGL